MQLFFNNKSFTLRIGDTLQLGYGANPDGSFMYIIGGKNIPIERHAGKTVVIKYIRYYKRANEISLTIKGRGIWEFVNVLQAMDKKEILSVNGVSFY